MVKERRFYDILGVLPDSPASEIKKAFKKLALKHHPDKGGDPDKFKEIAHAFEVLSDPKKRQIYDEGGEQALKEGGTDGFSGFHNPMDIFDMFFGGGRSRQPHRGRDTVHPLSVTLEELYNGATRKFNVTKNVICCKCEGRGGKPGAVQPCRTCKGRGVEIHMLQMGPGMFQQSQTICSACHGNKEIIDPKDRCTICMGKKVIREKKLLKVEIEKGMVDNQTIRFSGEGDQEPGIEPGDIVITIDEQPHERFHRRKADLIYSMDLSLSEALTGFRRTIKTLDDRDLLIETVPGEIIKVGDFRAIHGEGMPRYRNPFDKGSLIIKFTVEFPSSLSLRDCEKLRQILPRPADAMIPDDAEPCTMVDFDPQRDFNRPSASHREAYMDDESDEPGPQRVQCASQ
ncbi:unnamed protein product [Schistocephalus solidus]|uniref:DnaJ homolog subfamily A member 4 n=1 Tax=Schistocephalus solidus TaxID=70667 RepID=A0A0X3Q653_SCHSO|nr:unnamed protein product [Schistocephalus solidus]